MVNEAARSARALFSSDALDAIVKQTIPTGLLEDGHTNAIVGAVDNFGVKVVASFKLGDDGRWRIRGAGEHEWTGDNQVGAQVIYSW